jgi:hypothetical protein
MRNWSPTSPTSRITTSRRESTPPCATGALGDDERYVAPYFTADGRHDPSVTAQAVPTMPEELGVPTVPGIYRMEPSQVPPT